MRKCDQPLRTIVSNTLTDSRPMKIANLQSAIFNLPCSLFGIDPLVMRSRARRLREASTGRGDVFTGSADVSSAHEREARTDLLN